MTLGWGTVRAPGWRGRIASRRPCHPCEGAQQPVPPHHGVCRGFGGLSTAACACAAAACNGGDVRSG